MRKLTLAKYEEIVQQPEESNLSQEKYPGSKKKKKILAYL
jgi:hypothetical protein